MSRDYRYTDESSQWSCTFERNRKGVVIHFSRGHEWHVVEVPDQLLPMLRESIDGYLKQVTT